MQATGSSVAQDLSSMYRKQVSVNRSNVKRIFEALIFLGRQNIALRGHDETEDSGNRGNLLEFLELMSRSCPSLKQHLEGNVHYTSPSSQNTVIKLFGDSIQRRIMAQVKQRGVFGIICDETMDLSKVEQLSVNVRYVKDNLQVEEHFLGFWPLRRTDGETLFNHLKDVLSKLDLPLARLRAQCYDGAANMRGRYSGLAARVQEVAKTAVYVHCHAHQLNLALQQACNGLVTVRNELGTVSTLSELLERSAKRHAIFHDVQKRLLDKEEGGHVQSLKRHCETRWSSRYSSVHTVKEKFEAILMTLEELFDDDAIGADTAAVLKSISTFQFFWDISSGRFSKGDTNPVKISAKFYH